jgi:hypothetical protein
VPGGLVSRLRSARESTTKPYQAVELPITQFNEVKSLRPIDRLRHSTALQLGAEEFSKKTAWLRNIFDPDDRTAQFAAFGIMIAPMTAIVGGVPAVRF